MSANASAAKSFADGKILKSVADGVGILTFNNPEKRNAMSLEMWIGAAEALTELRDDPEARVVVLAGAGGKAFVSGGDISQFATTRKDAAAASEYSKHVGAPRTILRNYTKPTIASIQGFCLGGGMAMALSTDIRVAAEGSQFGIPATRLGIAYGLEGLTDLVQLVGPSRARLLMFTGMRIDAAQAEQFGLIDRLVPETELWTATMETARQIADNAPLAIAAARIGISEILKDATERDLDAFHAISKQCGDSEDFREGRTAFMEKRMPVFRGR